MTLIETISIDFPFESTTYYDDLDAFRENFESANVLAINTCPSMADATKLLAEPWFVEGLGRLPKLRGLILRIAGRFDVHGIEMSRVARYEVRECFLLSFEPQDVVYDYQSVILWKCSANKNFLQLENNKKYSSLLYTFVRDFLIKSALENHLGFDQNSPSIDGNDASLKITSLASREGLNLLMLAVREDSPRRLLFEILKSHFDINQATSQEPAETAADIAWQQRNFDTLLALLNANSCFPRTYDEDTASPEVRKFAAKCREMHDAVRESNLAAIEKIVTNLPNLRYFYNSKNKSAAAVAIETLNIEAYKLLLARNVLIGPREEFDDIKRGVPSEICKNLRTFHQQFSKSLPQKHLMVIVSNSHLGHDDLHSSERLNSVQKAYAILDSIPMCSKILQLVGAHRKFKVSFDFYRTSVECLDPATDKSTQGIFYHSGSIFIGAKELHSQKFVTIATIIHEFCHFAMVLVFRNEGKPYMAGDIVARQKFLDILKECERLKNEDHIVGWVFGYPEEFREAELIVRVVHMTAQYHEDQSKLAALKQTFKSLFDFFETEVKPQIEAAIPTIERLSDSENALTIGELSKPLREKMFNSLVNFQGFAVKLNEIIDCSDESCLLPMPIKSVFKDPSRMFSDYALTIGKDQQDHVDNYIERKFLKRKLDNKNQWEVRTCSEIASEVESERIFLLSDHAGAGKTTTFKHLVGELKEIDALTSCWISFVDLKRHLNIYREYDNMREGWGKEDVPIDDQWQEWWTTKLLLELLIRVLALDNKLELLVFMQLFERNKLVLLFDGVDEISPNFKEFIKSFFRALHTLTRNQLWIATRPQYTEELEEFLTVFARKLKPSDESEKRQFVESILHALGINEPAQQQHAIDKIDSFVEKLSSGSEDHAINNPLMLELITRLCADNTETEANFYAIYKEMLKKKVETVESRGDIVRADARDGTAMDRNFSIWQVFQWTPEKISRYGVLIVDNWNEKNEESDFIHRTFAEFFVAQYLIDNIYEESDSSVTDSEKLLRLKLLISIGATKSTEITRLEVIRRFLTSYPDMRSRDKGHDFDLKIKTFLINNYRASFLFYSKEVANYDVVTATLFLSNFFGKDPKIVDALWLGSERGSFFAKIFSSPQNSLRDILEYVTTVERIYGQRWPERTRFVRRRGEKYFLETRAPIIASDATFARLLRLLELVQGRLTRGQCRNFFGKYFFEMIESFHANQVAVAELIRRTREVFTGIGQLANLLCDLIRRAEPHSCIFKGDFVAFFWSHFSEAKLVRSILRTEFVPTSQPLVNAFASGQQLVVEYYTELYLTWLERDEVARLFVASKSFYLTNLFWRILHMEAKDCELYVNFVSELGGENTELMRRIIGQRDDKKMSVLGCLRSNELNAKTDEFREIYARKFEIFRQWAAKYYTSEEIEVLCGDPIEEHTFITHVWTKVINRRE